MRVVIKPIIKPQDNPTLNYREFDDVREVLATMHNDYALIHRDGSTKIEFHLPDGCYLIQQLDEQDGVADIIMK